MVFTKSVPLLLVSTRCCYRSLGVTIFSSNQNGQHQFLFLYCAQTQIWGLSSAALDSRTSDWSEPLCGLLECLIPIFDSFDWRAQLSILLILFASFTRFLTGTHQLPHPPSAYRIGVRYALWGYDSEMGPILTLKVDFITVSCFPTRVAGGDISLFDERSIYLLHFLQRRPFWLELSGGAHVLRRTYLERDLPH